MLPRRVGLRLEQRGDFRRELLHRHRDLAVLLAGSSAVAASVGKLPEEILAECPFRKDGPGLTGVPSRPWIAGSAAVPLPAQI
ncbi:MAG: hypothetical protein ABSF03_22710 [Streptosporangiaceae bacterium]